MTTSSCFYKCNILSSGFLKWLHFFLAQLSSVSTHVLSFPKISGGFWLLFHIDEWKIRFIIMDSLYQFLCRIWTDAPIWRLPWWGRLGTSLERSLATRLPETTHQGDVKVPNEEGLALGVERFLAGHCQASVLTFHEMQSPWLPPVLLCCFLGTFSDRWHGTRVLWPHCE